MEHDGSLSFALPVFEQHFGAPAISSGTFEIEAAASRDSFPSWRYSIASAVATCPDSAEREQPLCRVACTNPAALSWILDEIEPEATCRNANAGSHEAPSNLDRNAGGPGTSSDTQADSAIAAGLWLREALQALLDGYGSLATPLAHHSEDRLVQWGTHLASGYMTLPEHWGQTIPAMVSLPDFTHLRDLRPGGWRASQMFTEPCGDYGRWHWDRNRILKTLTEVIQRQALPTSAGTRINHERL
ncbi:hypothetical protein Caci_3863 [Catenulispora acidiphila DSM 44928]|uniref:Uncharacterized protein n=1 Tax=Catenulispora acidiphila (strain DSM 44928 / JCM 14897 / NBRC 102108 / NRRL B-24433 / ID139908) TaxID=479433 RepID=C7QDG4_CATAD|nr:hypothetical protein [Catenulispora acidiphila]ACU72757.1 hypothetical protein Caci_3863 [Catenulispora acidiphila DSM 44928]